MYFIKKDLKQRHSIGCNTMIVIHMKMGVIQDSLSPVLQVFKKEGGNILVIHLKNYTRNTGDNPYFLRLVLQSGLLPNFRILKFSNNISLIKKESKDSKELFLVDNNERSEFLSSPSVIQSKVIRFIAYGDAYGGLRAK